MKPIYVAQCRVDTPLGPLTLASSARGLAAAWFDGQLHHPGTIAAPVDDTDVHLRQAARELAAYFSDECAYAMAFRVPLDPQGTPFQQQVWQALRDIPVGGTVSYGEIARRVGRPKAVRAVGAAVGRNPLSIIVPCHRVVGSDGALTGYAGGLPRKAALLWRECSPAEVFAEAPGCPP
jgi:methylated-DNA-[protein]-cysteine S-methyltransferase